MSAVFSNRENNAPRDDEVARLRVPPNSIEAEQSVLGGLLLDNSAWDRAGDLLTASDFYRYEHKAIYAAVGALVHLRSAAPRKELGILLHCRNQIEHRGGREGDDGAFLDYWHAVWWPSAADRPLLESRPR